MTFPRARVTVAGCLFVAWLGYLVYLVVLSRHTIVLSRPQLLAADVVVLAEVSDHDGTPAPQVKVLEILRLNRAADGKLLGHDLEVANLPDAATEGYIGPGKYLLPLERVAFGPKGPPFARIRQVPANPGFEPAFVKVQLWNAGKEPEQAIALAVEQLGLAADTARKKLAPLVNREAPAVVLARGVRRDRAVEFIKKLHDADPGADAGLLGDDIRVYPWTPETKEQVEELFR